MTSVIITGSTGFIGRHLVNKLNSLSNSRIYGLNRSNGDISEKATWTKLPKADVVIHLAARCFIHESWEDMSGFLKTNLQGTIEALNYCRDQGSRLVYLSSYLYGNPSSVPVGELAALDVNNPYSFSKKLAEEACEFYSTYWDIPVTVLRPFNVYGPGQSETFIVPSLIKQISESAEIVVNNSTLKRDYLYVEDLVDAIVLALGREDKYSIFNIGSGQSYSGGELIDLIQKHSGTNLPVVDRGIIGRNEIMETKADIRKANQELAWTPKWSLSEGLYELIVNQHVAY